MNRTKSVVKVVFGVAVIASLALGVRGAQAAPAAPQLPYPYPSGVPVAGAANGMDCNGWSDIYKSAKVNLKALCTDPINYNYTTGYKSKFYDNGHYVGHDEPSVKFISTAPGTGNTFTFFQQLARDPSGTPTTQPSCSLPMSTVGITCLSPAASVSDYAELSVAPWFGLPMCDPMSFPNTAQAMAAGTTFPCTPDSDNNTPTNAGDAFMELQFYAPGYGPFLDSTSCDQTRWCVALNIDSLEPLSCLPNNPLASGCVFNSHCTEPINFAFLTHDGVPIGPPNPQNANAETFSPNSPNLSAAAQSDVLYMNPGDTLRVDIFETQDPIVANRGTAADRGGLETKVTDVTTGQTGFMVASAAVAFMNTNPSDCSGTPFSFHAEYNTASQQNQVGWAALEGGVLMQDEIGHGEVCAGTGTTVATGPGLANQDAVLNPYPPDIPPTTLHTVTFSDQNVFDNCNDQTADPTGDSPQLNGECATGSMSPGCNPETFQDAAGTDTFGGQTGTGTGSLEVADGYCLPKGSRTVTYSNSVGAPTVTWNDAVGYCDQARDQNGDLDYDGTTYQTLWPDGNAGHPTSFRYIGPFDGAGNSYPRIQFETDAAGSEGDCSTSGTTAGTGCTVPPYGAMFYPFWSVANIGLDGVRISGQPSYCVWNFGNDGNPGELSDFGGDYPNPTSGTGPFGQYGLPNTSRFAGTVISGVANNPQTNGGNVQIGSQRITGTFSCPSFTISQVVTQTGPQIPEAPWIPAIAIGGAGVAAAIGVRRQVRRRTA